MMGHPFANADYIDDDEDNMLGEDDGFNNYGQERDDDYDSNYGYFDHPD